MRPTLSIVLPCFNEAASLARLIQAYHEALHGREEVEAIFVDNGSTDKTPTLLRRLLEEIGDTRFRQVRVGQNRGYGNGLWAGLKSARGDFLSWSHADEQCPANDVLRLWDALKATGRPEEFFGKGVRVNDRGKAAWFSRGHGWFASILLGVPLSEINAQPKIFPRSLMPKLEHPPLGFNWDLYVYYQAMRAGLVETTVEVDFLPRREGVSSWAHSGWSRLKFILNTARYILELAARR